MGEPIEFVRNYRDLSTEKGFQFEFYCDRCGSGLRTRFQASATGTISQVLDTASSLFGGIFNKASDLSERVRSAGWQQSLDAAYENAVEEIRPKFIRCPRCNNWVCREHCWNVQKGLCKECAPDLGVEMAAAQANKSVQEVWAHAAMAEEDKKLDEATWRKGVRAVCPQCEEPLPVNAKFCTSCGAKIGPKYCAKCGGKLPENGKFCPECGEKTAES